MVGCGLVDSWEMHNFVHVVIAIGLEMGVRDCGVGDEEGPFVLGGLIVVVEDGGDVV
jgi:hypothetical protein